MNNINQCTSLIPYHAAFASPERFAACIFYSSHQAPTTFQGIIERVIDISNSLKQPTAPAVIVLVSAEDGHTFPINLIVKHILGTHYVEMRFIKEGHRLQWYINVAKKRLGERRIDSLILYAHSAPDEMCFSTNHPYRLQDVRRETFTSLPATCSIILYGCSAARGMAPAIADVAWPRPVFACVDYIYPNETYLGKCCDSHGLGLITKEKGTNEVFVHAHKQLIRLFQKFSEGAKVTVTYPCAVYKKPLVPYFSFFGDEAVKK